MEITFSKYIRLNSVLLTGVSKSVLVQSVKELHRGVA